MVKSALAVKSESPNAHSKIGGAISENRMDLVWAERRGVWSVCPTEASLSAPSRGRPCGIRMAQLSVQPPDRCTKFTDSR